jgi:hypothetical protein
VPKTGFRRIRTLFENILVSQEPWEVLTKKREKDANKLSTVYPFIGAIRTLLRK